MSKPSQEKPKPVESAERITAPTSPLIFISHDSRDAELAEAFSRLLSSVSAGVLKSLFAHQTGKARRVSSTESSGTQN